MNITLLAVFILSVAIQSSCETYHIVPDNSTERCEEEPYLTLDQLAVAIVDQNVTSLSLHFLSGEHHLTHDMNVGYTTIIVEDMEMIGISLNTTVWLHGAKLSISKVKDFVVENITFLSGGGSILIDECVNCKLNRCTFATIKLSIASNSMKIIESSFDRISDAVLVFSGNLFIIHCKFSDSSVEFSIRTSDVDSVFQAYFSFFRGKGITIKQEDGKIAIINCIFEDIHDGGAIKISEAYRIIVVNSTFANNYCSSKLANYIAKFRSSELIIENCNFIGNKNCHGVITTTTNNLSISNCKFSDNNCITTLHIYEVFSIQRDKKDALILTDSLFVNNNVSRGGGLASTVDALLMIANCVFTANYADNYGGAIFSQSEVTIFNSTFINNTAKVGGAIYIASYINISGCIFTNNHVTMDVDELMGTIIYIQSKTLDSPKKSGILNTVFTQNLGSQTVTTVGSKVMLKNTSFINNGELMQKNGATNPNTGCIYSFNSKLYITGPVMFTGNVGGGIHAVQSQVYISSTKEIVISNNTAYSGGGIMLRKSELLIRSQLSISGNRVEQLGGGIYAYQSVVDFKSTKSFIVNNFAGQNGGGIYAVASTIKLTNSYVTIGFNTAQHRGGGFHLQEKSNIYLFEQSMMQHSEEVILLIMSNSALYGGGIHVADNSTIGDLICQGVGNQMTSQKSNNDFSLTPECFLQTIRLYRKIISSKYFKQIKKHNLHKQHGCTWISTLWGSA